MYVYTHMNIFVNTHDTSWSGHKEEVGWNSYTHTCMHARTHARTQSRKHTCTHLRARSSLARLSHTHTCTHAHRQAGRQAVTHANKNAHIHARARSLARLSRSSLSRTPWPGQKAGAGGSTHIAAQNPHSY